MTRSSGELSRRSFLAGVAGAATLGLPKQAAGGRLVPTLSLAPFLARPTTDSILVSARNGQVDASARLEIKRPGPTPWTPVGGDRAIPAGEFITWGPNDLTAGTGYEYRVLMAEPGETPTAVAGGRFTTQRVGEVVTAQEDVGTMSRLPSRLSSIEVSSPQI